MTLLVRYAEGQSLPRLDELLHEWQQWCAELMESQLSYPMLPFYRSQHDNQSWLAALATIMDSYAMLMVGFKGVRTFRARLAFSTARQAVIEMGAYSRRELSLLKKIGSHVRNIRGCVSCAVSAWGKPRGSPATASILRPSVRMLQRSYRSGATAWRLAVAPSNNRLESP